MKLLIILNGGLSEKDGTYYVNNTLGCFLEELLMSNHNITVYYLSSRTTELSNMNDWALKSPIIVKSTRIRKSKLLTYAISFIQIGLLSVKANLIYLFYPGSLSLFILFYSSIFNKKLALYLRGELGLSSYFSKIIIKKSTFVLSVSDHFFKFTKDLCKNCNTIRPMIAMKDLEITIERKIKDSNELEFLYIGRIEKRKGVFDLLKGAIYTISKGYSNFKISIIGDGPEYKDCLEFIISNKLQERVFMYGAISDWEILKQHYLNADVFLFPSHDEGFPRVLYEAMGMGIPIITTFVGAIPNIMVDGFNCIRINTSDPNDLSNKMEQFLMDFRKYSYLSINANKTLSDYLRSHKLSHAQLLLRELNNL